MMAKGPSDVSLGLDHNFQTNGVQDISGQYSKGKHIWEMVGKHREVGVLTGGLFRAFNLRVYKTLTL